MYAEASGAGLNFDLFKRKLDVGDSDGDINVNESLSGSWWLLEYLPLRHLTYKFVRDGKGKETTRRCVRGSSISRGISS